MWVWTHPNRLFWQTIFRPLAPEIFTGARHSPRLASAHHKPGRGSTENFKSEQGTWLEAGVIKWTLILQGVTPTKFGRANNVRNSARFFYIFRLWSRISSESIDVSKIGKVLDPLHFIPYSAKKFGELWYTDQKVIDAHVDQLKWTFSEY